MKKLLLTLALLPLIGLMSLMPSNAQENKSIEVLPTMESVSTAPNRIWVGTFQIVWNETLKEVVKKPIKFVRYNSMLAKELNKQKFKKEYISDSSYFTTYGIVSPELRDKIVNAIKEKFNETSDIVDMFDWTYQPNKIFIYAMLKKDFKFLEPFDKLTSGRFGSSETPVEYFGIKEESSPDLYKNVSILFYNSEDDFGVKLLTKGDDVVLLYRTNENKTFDRYYADINEKTGKYQQERQFNRFDRLKVPNINLYQVASFPELEGHRIKGTNITIDKTIETVDFKMNNEGVELKSEAGIMARFTSLSAPVGRYFMFTDKFVLFLIEKNQQTPYFALRVDDVETLNKTGR